MELPAGLTTLLNATDLDNKELKWFFNATSDRVEIKLTWITKAVKMDKPKSHPKSGQALKNKSPSTRKHSEKRHAQWLASKAAVVQPPQTDSHSQTENTTTDSTSQTMVKTFRSTATQDRPSKHMRSLTPTRERKPSTAETTPVRKSIKRRRTIRSPSSPERYCHQIIYEDNTVDYGPSFDLDNPGYHVPDEVTPPQMEPPPSPQIWASMQRFLEVTKQMRQSREENKD